MLEQNALKVYVKFSIIFDKWLVEEIHPKDSNFK